MPLWAQGAPPAQKPWLESREAVDAFKAEHGVKSTPQTFIDGQRIGGYDDLRRFFGLKVADPDKTSYVPVVAVFAAALALALAASWAVFGALAPVWVLEWFIAFGMVQRDGLIVLIGIVGAVGVTGGLYFAAGALRDLVT